MTQIEEERVKAKGAVPSLVRARAFGVASPPQWRHYVMLVALFVLLFVLMVYPLMSGIGAAFQDKGRFSFFWIGERAERSDVFEAAWDEFGAGRGGDGDLQCDFVSAGAECGAV